MQSNTLAITLVNLVRLINFIAKGRGQRGRRQRAGGQEAEGKKAEGRGQKEEGKGLLSGCFGCSIGAIKLAIKDLT
jgi:hypothetical protein